jgi:hypothetical protein
VCFVRTLFMVIAYRDKKVVGVFVPFRYAASPQVGGFVQGRWQSRSSSSQSRATPQALAVSVPPAVIVRVATNVGSLSAGVSYTPASSLRRQPTAAGAVSKTRNARAAWLALTSSAEPPPRLT